MDIKELFYAFLNSLEGNSDKEKNLLESVKNGFDACYEAESSETAAVPTEEFKAPLPEDWSKAPDKHPDKHPDEGKTPTIGDIYTYLDGQPLAIDVFVDSVKTTHEPEDTETGIHEGNAVEDYTAHANIWLLDDNEERTSTVATIPDSKFKEIMIPGQKPQSLEDLVTDHLNSEIDKWVPDPEPEDDGRFNDEWE